MSAAAKESSGDLKAGTGARRRPMVVYIDVLFVLNLIINYFLLLAVSRILDRHDGRPRILAGAAMGALYACFIFFPELSFLYSAVLKLCFSISIVAVAYKCGSVKTLFKLLCCFYVTCMLFGGVIYAVEYFFAPPALSVRNGVAYMDLSPIFLILSGAGCYILITLFSRLLHRNVHTEDIYRVEIEVDGVSVAFAALFDNGNDLTDAISGLPVVIAEYSRVEPLLPLELRSTFKTGKFSSPPQASGFGRRFRVVPYGSVGNAGGLLPAFRPDRLAVKKAGVETSDVLVAVTSRRLSDDGLFSLLLNPRLFSAETNRNAPKTTIK